MTFWQLMRYRLGELWARRSHRAYAAWMDRDFQRWRQDRRMP